MDNIHFCDALCGIQSSTVLRRLTFANIFGSWATFMCPWCVIFFPSIQMKNNGQTGPAQKGSLFVFSAPTTKQQQLKQKKRGGGQVWSYLAIWYKLSWGTLGNSRHKYETFMIFRCNTTEQVFYVRNIHNTLQRQEEKVTERSTFLSKHTCCLITIAANVMIWNGMPQCHTTIPYPLTIWICQFKMGTWRKKHHTMMCEKQPYSLPMKMTNFAFFCNMLFQLKKTAQWFGSH